MKDPQKKSPSLCPRTRAKKPLPSNSAFTSTLPERASPIQEDSIAAIATPFGQSGIGIVRLSGPFAESISHKIFRQKGSSCRLVSHRLTYGEIVDPENARLIDEVMVVFMKAPKTYTREDVLEIHCHGGYLVLQKVLEIVLRQGVRMALPGEFTKRAFLSGRIDLTQAEAVIDLINAKTTIGLDIANQQLRGSLLRELEAIRECLVDRLVLIEAHIDFPEEEIDPVSRDAVAKDLEGTVRKIDRMLDTFEEGRIFREGVSCAIVGKTNVGKSSLLNTLVSEDRAIVTPIPGTTRDVIEEVLNIRDVPVRLVDTAGLRKTVDPIEIEGVRRTRERVTGSDFVLLVLDGSCPLDDEDREIFKEATGKKKVVIVNKRDLPQELSLKKVNELSAEDPIVSISALRNEGIDALKDAIYSSLIHRNVRTSPEYLILANVRHKNALSKARENIENALRGLGDGISLEFVAFEVRSALDALGEIVGETATEEVLDRIFEQFCVGK